MKVQAANICILQARPVQRFFNFTFLLLENLKTQPYSDIKCHSLKIRTYDTVKYYKNIQPYLTHIRKISKTYLNHVNHISETHSKSSFPTNTKPPEY